MAEHKAWLSWRSDGNPLSGGRYSRVHGWRFDGGTEVRGSSSPSVVRPPFSDPAAVDPEEALVASIASCHLMTFLYEAGRAGFEVDLYEDEAVGKLTKNERGVPWLSEVVLSPRQRFVGARQPSDQEIEALHERAHDQCFISNSVKTHIEVRWQRL